MTNFEVRGPIPAGSGPLARLTSPELSGRSDDTLKQDFIQAVQRAASNTQGIRVDLQALGWGVNQVAEAVDSLGHQLVPRFDAQIQYLGEQLSLLHSIDRSLKNPRRVQAAERISQTAHLLSTRQYDWALAYAQEAIEHDATNPGGFMAAGWALIGQKRIKDSIDCFIRASHVAGNYSISKDYKPYTESIRQLARCQLAIGDTREVAWARYNLGLAVSNNAEAISNQKQHVKKLESTSSFSLTEARAILESREADRPALMYEFAIAAVAEKDTALAISYLEAAVRLDERYAKLAVGEPLLERSPPVVAHVVHVALELETERRRAAEKRRQKEEEARQKLAEKMAKLPPLTQAHQRLEKSFTQMKSPFYAADDIQAGEQSVRTHLDTFLAQVKDNAVDIETLTITLDRTQDEIANLRQLWAKYYPTNKIEGYKNRRKLDQHRAKVLSISL